MKSTINKLIKTFFVATLVFAGAAFADAAQFDSNPSGNTGITSIVQGSCTSCGGQNTSVSVNINQPGQSTEVTVFTDFMAKRGSTETVLSARGRYTVKNQSGLSSPTFTFGSSLSASNAASISDNVSVSSLPNSYKIEFVSGHIENTHGGETINGEYCHPDFDYNIPVDNTLFTSTGDFLGDLVTTGNSWCAQGTIAVKYRITNTGQVTLPLDVQTNDASNITTTSAVLNGRVNQGNNVTVKFAFGTNTNPSCSGTTVTVGGNPYNAGQNFSATKSGLQPNTTYYFKACGQSGSQSDEGSVKSFTTTTQQQNLRVQTNNASNITTNSARLNGEVLEGQNAQVWFALTMAANTTNCSSQGQTVPVGGTYNAGQNFSATTSYPLSPNTTYYFRACGRDQINGPIKSGLERQFTTEQTTTNYTYEWEARGWGACNNNIQVREYVCIRYPGGVQVSDSLCIQNVGPKPYETRACGITGNNLEVETLGATDIGPRYATLNGRVTSGTTNNVYFVYDYVNNSLNCANPNANIRYAENHTLPRSTGDTFHYTFPNLVAGELQPDTEYHYRACATNGSVITTTVAQGNNVRFRTTSDGSTTPDPQAETRPAEDEDEDSAELNGRIRMNDIDDGIVFFVYGQDEGRIDTTEIYYNTYNQVENSEDEDEYMVVLVDDNNDENDWRSYSRRVSDLEEDKRYYFKICVEYQSSTWNDNPRLECGETEDFRTDDEGNNDDEDLEIRTDNPRSVTQTTAEMCGTLIDDGGENRVTYLEFRQSNGGSFNQTPERQRGEGQFCERVSGLLPATSYSYRACADGECASERTFRTSGTVIQQNVEPTVITELATDIRSNYALLRGTYISYADRATVWFNYGRTQGLGSETRRQTVNGSYGEFTHPFTNLAANTTYYYQAAIQTVNGFDTGAIYSFRTNGGGVIISQPPVIVVQDDDTDIDLSSLGLGLSLVRLDIDNNQEVVSEGSSVEYVIEWQNISELDLTDLELKITIPPEIQITNYSRGRLDLERNIIYYTIDRLEGADFDNNIPGESGEMTVRGIVGDITIGSLVTAEAELSYDNPVNQAKESALDFDVDEAGFQVAGVTASIFGLGNITFLGWLVILLGLFIIFLIARWLYLEREEMRAQAYASGYRPYVAGPGYDAYGRPIAQMPVYQEPRYDVPPAAPAPRDDYQPYRPNRG